MKSHLRHTSNARRRSLLEGIVKHSHKQGQPITTVYIDDCCKLRKKIESVFSSETNVKLDLFHAVQRITKTLSRKHPMYHQYGRSFARMETQDHIGLPLHLQQ